MFMNIYIDRDNWDKIKTGNKHLNCRAILQVTYIKPFLKKLNAKFY